MEKHLLSFFLLAAFCACRPGEKDPSLSGEVTFEFLDSMVVESLLELYIADKDGGSGRLLLNEKEMRVLFLTDSKGGIISRFKLDGEGPNQVQNPSEVAFWKDGLVTKETSSEMKLSFFNGEFEKTGVSPAIARDFMFLTILNSGRSFSVLEKEGKSLIIGQDNSALEAQLMTSEEGNAGFYEKAETGYIVSDQNKLVRLNLYPETWKPRMEKKWVGISSPLVQVCKTDQVIAVLPTHGNQLFYYTLKDTSLTAVAEITLVHPERHDATRFDATDDDGVLYPAFSRLNGGGNYFLVEFRTAFPRDLYESFRANDERFRSDPEFWQAVETHHKTKYILADTKGNQGAISELPISGDIHFMDADDVLYIKRSSETELDYNVFYRYRVSLN